MPSPLPLACQPACMTNHLCRPMSAPLPRCGPGSMCDRAGGVQRPAPTYCHYGRRSQGTRLDSHSRHTSHAQPQPLTTCPGSRAFAPERSSLPPGNWYRQKMQQLQRRPSAPGPAAAAATARGGRFWPAAWRCWPHMGADDPRCSPSNASAVYCTRGRCCRPCLPAADGPWHALEAMRE